MAITSATNETAEIFGETCVPQYEPLGHTPSGFLAGVEGGTTIDALTTNVDLFATLADVFDAQVGHRTHGTSLKPLLENTNSSIRDWAIGGVWGNWVQITDGNHKYARSAVESNYPISIYSNRWSTMPIHVNGIMGMPPPDQRLP